MGLAHSFWQGEYGTWRWSRGHAVDDDFGTVMTYGPQLGRRHRIHVFSSPRNTCIGVQEVERPCGIDGEEVNGADAVTTLSAVRFQIAAFRPALLDSDEDGVGDNADPWPGNPAESVGTDGDGVGNNADRDDDNDSFADHLDAFPLNAADGAADRTIHLGHVASQQSSWKVVGESNYDEAGISVASVPDTDGDGKAELLIGAWGHDPGERSMAGATYFLVTSDFSAADAADGAQDGVIDLGYPLRQLAP